MSNQGRKAIAPSICTKPQHTPHSPCAEWQKLGMARVLARRMGRKQGTSGRRDVFQSNQVKERCMRRDGNPRRISPLLPFRIHIDIYRKNCRGQFLRKSLAVGNTLRQTLNPRRPLLSCSNDTQKVPCRFTFFFAFPCVVLIREDTSNHQIRYFKYATKIEPIVQGTSI